MRMTSAPAACARESVAPSHQRRIARLLTFAVAGLAAGACATSEPAYDQRAGVGAKVAVVMPPLEREADGVAVQAPPRVKRHAAPDDPSEPFSPNYGPAPDGVNDIRPETPYNLKPAEPKRPEPQRQALRHSRSTASAGAIRSRHTPFTEREANAIMARAITAHERRYP